MISQTGYVTEDNYGNAKINPIALFSVRVNGTMWFISSKKWSRKSTCLLWICSSITCDTNTNVITYDTVWCSKQSRKIDIIILLYNKAPRVSLSHCFSQIHGLHEDNDLNGKLCRLCCLDANTEIWTFHQNLIKIKKIQLDASTSWFGQKEHIVLFDWGIFIQGLLFLLRFILRLAKPVLLWSLMSS